jgi:hypothetical protein
MTGRSSPGGTAARTEATGGLCGGCAALQWLGRDPCETLIPCRSQLRTMQHPGWLPDEFA